MFRGLICVLGNMAQIVVTAQYKSAKPGEKKLLFSRLLSSSACAILVCVPVIEQIYGKVVVQ